MKENSEEISLLGKHDHAERVFRNETNLTNSLLLEISVSLSMAQPDEIEDKIYGFLDMVSRTWVLDQIFMLQWASEDAATEPGECYSCYGWPRDDSSKCISPRVIVLL